MAKVNRPLFSLSAVGALGRHLVYRRRGKGIVAQQTARPVDRRSFAQLQWRTLYQKAVALWHLLSPSEKEAWERQATPLHMTGFAYFVSQALKPNPGIYLPLAGGTMTGDIDMTTNKILNLPAPTADEEPTRKVDLATHAALTTATHGAGTDHLALFGVASTVVSRIVGKLTANYLFHGQVAQNNSSFKALINGAPSSTSVVYDTHTNELSLPRTDISQWGKVILHNITRGNTRKITGVNLATNTIATEASADDWANNDIITTGSQTCVYTGGDTYSRFFDVDISSEVPSTAKIVIVKLFNTEGSGVGVFLQNGFGIHPYEIYTIGKIIDQICSAGYQSQSNVVFCPVISQTICVAMGRYWRVNASGMYAAISLQGYIE